MSNKGKIIAATILGGGGIALGHTAINKLLGFAVRKSPELYIASESRRNRKANDKTNELLERLISKENSHNQVDPRRVRKIEPLA